MTNLANAPDRDPQVYLLPRDPTVRRSEVTITEKRAPTDESVRLLREMEAKMRAEVLKAVSVESNGFHCVVQQSISNIDDTMTWRAVFKLNGKTMTAEHVVSARDQDWRGSAAGLRNKMAEVIAVAVLDDAFVDTIRSRWR